jgi:hypothetical protein
MLWFIKIKYERNTQNIKTKNKKEISKVLVYEKVITFFVTWT